ncbi:transposase [Scytonema sp. NUACC26]
MLGIDEISLVKGQGKFIVVLVDIDSGRLIGLVKERKQMEIENVMKKWGDSVLERIEEVSMDLTTHCPLQNGATLKPLVLTRGSAGYPEIGLPHSGTCKTPVTGNYKSLVDKICPNAVVTVDRFHVTKIIHEELNQARIAEKKTASELKVEDREKIFDSLKGNKFTILKAEDKLTTHCPQKKGEPSNPFIYRGVVQDIPNKVPPFSTCKTPVTDKQKIKLDASLIASPLIAIMHSLKEEFRDLFDTNEDSGTGILGLLDWLEKAEPYYQKSGKTIKRWFGEIAGYFERKTTNGVVEGINNKLKLIKRNGFGFRNFRNFEIRALLSWHYDINLAR